MILGCHHFIWWRATHAKLQKDGRLPVTSILALLMIVLILIGLILMGENVANFYNGLSWMLLSLSMVPYYVHISIVLRRYVRLGERIIPLGKHMGIALNERSEQSHVLRRFGGFGRLLVVFQLVAACISTIVLSVVGPLDPSNSEIHGTVGLVFKGQFQLFSGLGILWQLTRCIQGTSTTIHYY
jgi:hypothetical protein